MTIDDKALEAACQAQTGLETVCMSDLENMRLPVSAYLSVRDRLFELGYRGEWEWAQTVKPPTSAEHFAGEAIWVICCSGFREQAARVTQGAVKKALRAGLSATTVFPASGKGRAIDKVWFGRDQHFEEFQSRLALGRVIDWLPTLPYVGGPILRYHFAKNLGVDVAKPDRHLCRLAGVPENGPVEANFQAAMDLCRPIAAATGDRIATVDVVLWRACNLGILSVDETGSVILDLLAGVKP